MTTTRHHFIFLISLLTVKKKNVQKSVSHTKDPKKIKKFWDTEKHTKKLKKRLSSENNNIGCINLYSLGVNVEHLLRVCVGVPVEYLPADNYDEVHILLAHSYHPKTAFFITKLELKLDI